MIEVASEKKIIIDLSIHTPLVFVPREASFSQS